MRWKRKQLDGFIRDGRAWVYLNEQALRPSPGEVNRADAEVKATETHMIDVLQAELRRRDRDNADLKAELVRLQDQLDRVLADAREDHRRAGEERQQMMEQQERHQVLQGQLQQLIQHLQDRPAIAGPPPEVQRRLDRLEDENVQLKSGLVQLIGWAQRQR